MQITQTLSALNVEGLAFMLALQVEKASS